MVDLIDEFGTIDKVPNDVLTQTVKDIEVGLGKDILTWKEVK
jgi:hypothetical protein